MRSQSLKTRAVAVLLALLAVLPAAGAELEWHKSLAPALAQARGRPILIDFQAAWCYSCYYMDQHVLSRPGFAAAARNLLLVKLDVDLEEGKALKEKYRVSFLPSYVLVDGDGKTLGRIVGEQTEADFLARLGILTAGLTGGPELKVIESLREKLSAGEYDEAARLAKPEKSLAVKLDARQDWKILKARLGLMRAVKTSQPGGLDSLAELVKLESSCDLAYDLSYGEKLLDKAPLETRKTILGSARRPMEKLVEERVFKGSCADFRTGVEILVGIYQSLGMAEARTKLLDGAIAHLESVVPEAGQDRNRDDNLRYFLEMVKADAKLKVLYPKLAEAYSTDYVYPYRFARYLQERNESSEALYWIEKAARLCYGLNRLTVSKVHARILAALGRKPEAMAILRRDINSSSKSFPKEAQGLQELLSEISK